MSIFAWVVIITTIAGVGGTAVGGLLGALFNKDNNKIVSLLLAFAGGVMLAVVCFDLIPSAIMPETATEPTNIFIVIAGVILGFAVVFLLNHFIDKDTDDEIPHIDETHPLTADAPDEIIHSNHYVLHAHKDGNKEMVIAGIVMSCAIALHNVPEGMVIGASMVNSGIIVGGSGLTLAIIIGLHNIPEGMGISVPLIAGGTNKVKAVLITALCGLPTVIGAIIGYFLGILGPFWLSMSLSFASGAMLYVVFGELIPEAILMFKSKLPAVAIMVGLFVGLIITYV